MSTNQQLELGFEAGARPRRHSRGGLPARRAQWWFRQMHRVVDQAFAWRNARPARPIQNHFQLVSPGPRWPGGSALAA